LAFHSCNGGPSGPREVGFEKKGKTAIERSTPDSCAGSGKDTFGADGNGDGEFFGGESVAGEAIGKKGRNNIIGAFTFGILAETEVEISAKVNYGEVVGGVVEIGGGNGKGGGELDFGEVAELEILLFGGESDGKLQDGLTIDGDAETPVVDAKVLDRKWPVGLVTRQGAALDTIDEGKEVVP
jgi:hypothetical protein